MEELEAITREQMSGKTPLRIDFIDPADVAPTVFLASEGVGMITGARIDVTAGDGASNAA